MSSHIEEEVIRLDATDSLTDQRTLLQILADSVEHTDSGVVDVFRILVREDLSKLSEHEKFYERLLHSALSLRLILLCTTGGAPATQALANVQIPESLLNAGSRVRVLIVEDNIGIYFGADRGTARALAVWPEDMEGTRTLQIIEEALKIPEVFNDVFRQTEDVPHRAFSVGTRQAWFGRLPTDAISGVFKEVGLTITGGDSFSALERRPPEWEIPPFLAGNYREEDLLKDEGALRVAYDQARRLITDTMKWFGIKSGYPITRRIARMPDAQMKVVAELANTIRSADTAVRELVEEVEASDGFDDKEASKIEAAGIRLYRDDTNRNQLKDARTELLQNVVNKILEALAGEQSVSPYFSRLDKTIETVKPRTKEEVREELGRNSLASVCEKLEQAGSTPISGKGVLVAKRLALLLAERWFQLLLVITGVAGLLGVIDHLFDSQTPDLLKDLALLGPARQELRLLAELLFVLVTATLIASALLLTYADSEIKKWGRALGLGEIQQMLDSHEAFISQVALNDWILNKTRRSAIEPLELLRDDVLKEVVGAISTTLIDESATQHQEFDDHSFNPAVRRTFQAAAHMGIFKNLPQVKRVLSKDIIWMIKTPIEAHCYSLLGSNATAVGPRIVNDVVGQLEKYVQSVYRYGVYSRNHLIDEHDGERERQKLIDQYWSEADSINELLNGIVLSKETDPMVQFIQAESLSQLDSAAERTKFVRFAPRTSRLEEISNSADQRDSLRQVVFTRSAEIGGVLRLIGYREGTVF